MRDDLAETRKKEKVLFWIVTLGFALILLVSFLARRTNRYSTESSWPASGAHNQSPGAWTATADGRTARVVQAHAQSAEETVARRTNGASGSEGH